MSVDLRVLAVLDPSVLHECDPVVAARAAVAGGATAVQVRDKVRSAGALVRLARDLVRALEVPVYVNDRADVALAAGAAGVHVGHHDISPADVRRLAPAGFRVGVSVGTPEEANAVRDAPVDYWSLGPAFPTDTKSDAGPPLNPQGLRTLRALAPAGLPVIGIGGITPDNAGDVIRAGCDGVAVINAIFAAPDPESATRALRRAVDAARAP